MSTPPRHLTWTVAIVASLTMAVSHVDRSAFSVLAPTVTHELGISETGYGWLSSAFSMAYLLAVPVAGLWLERMGPRRGLVASVLMWSGVAAVHAVVPGFAILFVLRIALGVAEAPAFPGTAQTIQRVLPAEHRSRGFGLVFAGSSVGFMVAPPLASALYDLAGWRIAFLGTAAVGALWVPVWMLATRRADVRALMEDAGPQTPTARPRLREVVSNASMVRGLAAIFAVAPVAGFVLMWAPKYLVRTQGLRQGAVGHYLWLPPVAFAAGALLFGDLASRQRRTSDAPPRALFAVGTLLAGCLALLPSTTTPWQATACLSVAMLGAGAGYTLVTADLLARVPQTTVAFASGVLSGAQSLAYIIANPLIGHAADAYAGYGVAVVAVGAWVLPGSIIWLAWRPAAGVAKVAA